MVQYLPNQHYWEDTASYYHSSPLAKTVAPSLITDDVEANNPSAAHKIEHSEESCIVEISCCDIQSQALTQMFPESALLVPFQVGGVIWGNLGLVRAEAYSSYQAWEVTLIQTIADQLAIAIQQAELYQKLQAANQALERLAMTDGLTQIANRRHFDQSLNHEWQRLSRSQQPLTLILRDIDFFKLYNDTYGHPTGDRCLAQIAQILNKVTQRSTDLAARHGGEEFAILLPNTTQAGAVSIAQLILNQLQHLHLPYRASTAAAHVTLSLGIASFVPCQDATPQALIQAADQALYQAKIAGRNTYKVWDGLFRRECA